MTVVPARHAAAQVPATTANLGPGFDAFGAALSLHLWVRSTPRGDARVTTAGEGAGELSTGDDNLVWRSFVAFCEDAGVAVPDVSLEVDNRIPLERGLGSSSSAIVAGATVARAVTGAAVGDLDVVRLATRIEGHPDNVAPAVLGGLVACTETDDGRLVVRRRDPAAHLRPVALVPTDRQATPAARAVLPATLPRREVALQASRAGHVLAGLLGAWPVEPAAAGDRLHEPPRLAAMRGSAAALGELRAAGVHAWLSGAGPTVLATIPAGDPAPGEVSLPLLRDVATRHGLRCLALGFDRSGAFACPDDGCAFAGGTCSRCPRARV